MYLAEDLPECNVDVFSTGKLVNFLKSNRLLHEFVSVTSQKLRFFDSNKGIECTSV